jgi:hypothetical protein
VKVDSDDFAFTMNSLMVDLSQHMNEIEMADLPVLEKALNLGDSRKLANSFKLIKAFVPSRCHPTTLGFVAAPFDYICDMFRKFPNQDSKVLGSS